MTTKQAPRVAVATYGIVRRVIIEQADHYIEMTVPQAEALVRRLQKQIAEEKRG